MTANQELLASVPLFAGLPAETLARLDRRMIEREFPAGTDVVTEGDAGVAFFLITDGTAAVLHGPQKIDVRTLGRGEYFGEIALLDGRRRTATVRAIETLHCLALARWDFLAEVRADPDLAIHLLETVTARLREAEAQLYGAEEPVA